MTSYPTTEFGEYGELEAEGAYEQFGGDYDRAGRPAGPLNEAQTVQLASELMEITNEAELEQFLGDIISKVGKAAGSFIKSPVGQALGGILKGVAKKALPVVGGALGSMVAPGIGTALGGQLGSLASGMFELELESLPGEQAEFEVAKRVVGLTAASASRAAQIPPRSGLSPHQVARAAVAEAARDYAPGLYRQMAQRAAATGGRTPSGLAAQPGPGGQVPAQAMVPPGPGRPGPRRGFARGGYGGDFWDVVPEEPLDGGWGPGGDDYPGDTGFRATTGRWVRRGRRIVLLGI